MLGIFNCGYGMVVITNKEIDIGDKVVKLLENNYFFRNFFRKIAHIFINPINTIVCVFYKYWNYLSKHCVVFHHFNQFIEFFHLHLYRGQENLIVYIFLRKHN